MKVNKIYATLVALTMAATSVGAADKAAAGEKVMRYAFRVAETGFDPAKVSDIYSRTVTEAVFEGLYGYDFLARPSVVKPLVADGMPVISNDYKNYTIKLQKGILFADDPAFCDAQGQNCKKREVTAQDFVYSYKRLYDPKNKSPVFSDLEEARILGMDVLRKAAEKPGAKFRTRTACMQGGFR